MAQSRFPKGQCAFCGRKMTKAGLARHLGACPQRKEAIQAADEGEGKSQPIYHLRVQDKWWSGFWLHLEMNATATLESLDRYLRHIWLECCGHLSQFSIGGWSGEEIPMERRVDQVFEPGLELTHIYDFGSSSYTLVKMVGARVGKPLTAYPIYLMARNNPPEVNCTECGQPATWICMECEYELEEPGALCEQHSEEHEHDEEMLMPLVNSPRVGICGYAGPAEPPY